jgi:AcrR family transcriptional regulator
MTKEKRSPFQEQLVKTRQELILNAATEVFAQKGFARATTRDVAKAAGIAEGTIYNYFENKTALLLGILNRLNESERREQDLSSIKGADLRTFFREYLTHRLRAISQDASRVLQIILSEVLINPELRELYLQNVITPTFSMTEPIFAKLVTEGKIRAINVPLTLRALASTFLGLLTLRILGDSHLQQQWEELPEVLCTLFLDGLLPG